MGEGYLWGHEQCTNSYITELAFFLFWNRISLDFPGGPRTELKQSSCLSLPRVWDHSHVPLNPFLNCTFQWTLVNVKKETLSWVQYCKGLRHGKKERKATRNVLSVICLSKDQLECCKWQRSCYRQEGLSTTQMIKGTTSALRSNALVVQAR